MFTGFGPLAKPDSGQGSRLGLRLCTHLTVRVEGAETLGCEPLVLESGRSGRSRACGGTGRRSPACPFPRMTRGPRRQVLTQVGSPHTWGTSELPPGVGLLPFQLSADSPVTAGPSDERAEAEGQSLLQKER